MLLAVALFVLGARVGSPDGGGDEERAGDGAAAGEGSSKGDGGDDVLPAVDAPPTIEATARSIRFQGVLSELGTLRLTGTPSASFAGEVVDGAGTSLGRGSLSATGTDLSLTGTKLRVEFGEAELHLGGDEVRFVNGSPRFEFLRVKANGRITLAAPTISFTKEGAGAAATPLQAPVTLVPTENTQGGVGVRAEDDLVWADAPSTVRLTGTRRVRTTLSWAGDGVVRASGAEHRAVHLGVKASELDVTAERAGGGVFRLRGRAALLQAYVDGMPVLRAQGRVQVKSKPGQVPRGGRGWFTWAPENDGATDMAIVRIRPDNPEASWVSLGLYRLPSMCGGEVCEPRGGDTTGFTRGRGINAVIIPGTGDERDISFRVPNDAALGRHEIAIVVEGNFEPIRVVVDFVVVEPPATTSANPPG